MQKDTRANNIYFNNASIEAYKMEYADKLKSCLGSISSKDLASVLVMMKKADRIYVAGNGGSAAISDHLCCDWQKGTFNFWSKPIAAQSLSSNASLMTAIANDMSYSEVFSFQLELANLTYRDLVVLISSSGNSANIVKAARLARARNAQVIGLTGFDGGELKTLSTVSLHIPFHNYGIVEDSHQAIMHILAQYYFVTDHATPRV